MNKKVVIVTGGSRGIGKDISQFLARKGYEVILNYNKSEKEALEIRETLKKENINIHIFKANVSKKADVESLVDFCIQKLNKIDVLINNAGISQVKMFQDITIDDWENMIRTNLTSCFFTIKEVLPYMISKKQGCIINISSIWGQTGAACEVHYSV